MNCCKSLKHKEIEKDMNPGKLIIKMIDEGHFIKPPGLSYFDFLKHLSKKSKFIDFSVFQSYDFVFNFTALFSSSFSTDFSAKNILTVFICELQQEMKKPEETKCYQNTAKNKRTAVEKDLIINNTLLT